jgi:hypothetical protein
MPEKKKPSSLRGRVDRARKVHSKPMNPTPIIIGVVFVVLAGIGLYVVWTPPTPYKQPSSTTSEPPQPQPVVSEPAAPRAPAKPKTPREAAWALCEEARLGRKSDPDGALSSLRQGLGQYPQYKADFYSGMAMCVEEKIKRAGGNPSKSLRLEKLEYLREALAAVEAGSEWFQDPRKNKTGFLKRRIEVAEGEANK